MPHTSLPRLLGLRGILAGLVVAFLVVPLIGLPTAVVPNRFFVRMTPTRPQDYLFLALTALLVGLIAATYVAPQGPSLPGGEGRPGGATVSSPSSRSVARSATRWWCSPWDSAGHCAGSRRASRCSASRPGRDSGHCAPTKRIAPLMP